MFRRLFFPHCNFQRLKSAPSTLILDADFINVAADFAVFQDGDFKSPEEKIRGIVM